MAHTPDEIYIWITRWKDFQHYLPRRDRGPAWIKDYTAQLADAAYLRLSDRRRALLRDLRDVFATFRGQLPYDPAMITRQRHSQTRRADLEALNHAGFISFVSREGLEQNLEELYSPSRRTLESRAPARSREVEQEKRDIPKAVEKGPKVARAHEAPDDWHATWEHEPTTDEEDAMNGPGFHTLKNTIPELRPIP